MRNGEDMNEFMENPQKRIEMVRRKEYQEELKYLLPRMLHMGFFEDDNWMRFTKVPGLCSSLLFVNPL